MINSEVIIIGGGPAGSTCAWKLQQAGIETIVLDRSRFPRTKLCAGWITPKVVKDLQLDVKTYPHSLVTFDRIHFRVHGRKLGVKTRQYSIRRYEFDHWLLQRAGVPVFHHKAELIRREDGHYLVDDEYRCTYLVGAGGTHCPVYRTFFETANPRAQALRIITMEQELAYRVDDRNCYLWFFENDLPGYSWYVPKGNGYLNLGIGGKYSDMKSRGDTIRGHWDRFVRTLAERSLINNLHFHPQGYNYYLRQDVRLSRLDNAFLVGDAAGLATKDLGEGIGPAVESGILAANAIIHGTKYSLRSITKYSLPNMVLPWRW